MRPERVAYVVGVFPKISETFIAHEVAEVRQRGIEVRILSLRQPAEELRHPIVAKAGLQECTLYDSNRFSALLQEFRPTLLHAHFATQATQVARELSEQLRVPFTFTAHRYDIYDKAPDDFARRAAACGRFATVSETNARYIVQTFGVPAEQIRVIPCGVDLEFFQPPKNLAPSVPPLIVCVARHAKPKNLPLLLHVCAELRRQTRFHCVLVGDGALRGELEILRRELGLQDCVELVGSATQEIVRQWWHRATVAILTSDSEGMPVCLMEAAACGVPAVATAVGGIPELVEHGVTGLLAPPGDCCGLVAALQTLLSDPQLRCRMGIAARARACSRFSLQRQGDQLLALWAEVLKSWNR